MTTPSHDDGVIPDPIDLTAVLALRVGDQLEIAHALYGSVPEGEIPRVELSDEMKQELDWRLQDGRDNPDDCIPWEEVERSLMARVGKDPGPKWVPPASVDLAAMLSLPVADRLWIADSIYANLPEPPPGPRYSRPKNTP